MNPIEFLPFEKPIEILKEKYDQCIELVDKTGVNTSDTCKKIKKKLEGKITEIHKKLTPWQRVQLSRHPNRPYTLDYINNISDPESFIELHGDRNFADDKAMVGGFGKIQDQTFMMIGTQKGRNTKERQYRRFGMPNPEGYRKALRLMKLAEKFNKPIVTFIDTPGAFPGLEAEERGQGEAIARNIYEMMLIKVPIIAIIIGEGASGGALGIGIGDKVLMLENSWYSVISPENCSTILWRNWEHKEQAAEALKLTAKDMLQNKLIDGIIKEPLGGAHLNSPLMYETVRKSIWAYFKELELEKMSERIDKRQKKFSEIGIFKD